MADSVTMTMEPETVAPTTVAPTTVAPARVAPATAEQPAGEQATAPQEGLVFGGETRNMAMGVAMLAAGGGAFVLGLTHTFFAQAIAIVFVFWGFFFVYSDLLLSTRRFIVSARGLQIDIPLRLWGRSRFWEWADISRLDIVTYRRDIDQSSAVLQLHHRYPQEIALEREDRSFEPELAQLIIQHATLKPDAAAATLDFGDLPIGSDATYTWKK